MTINFNRVHRLSIRLLGNKFKVGKTQISDILKHENELIKYYRSNNVADKIIRMFRGVSGCVIIDKFVLEWFRRVPTQKKICGESASVNEYTVEEWSSNIAAIIEGYVPRNIFNANETTLLYRELPDKM